MLVHLHVKNLALIQEAEVDFTPGLNIFTGETGAGKSILLGSMQLILGTKMSKEMIREKEKYALVELLFQIEEQRVKEQLEKLDIYPEDGQVLLSRKIMDSRSISKINGETCTVGQMKAAAACLLDIHGQHEHQSLLRQEKQLEIIDAYGKKEIDSCRRETKEAYLEYQKYKRQLNAMNMDEEQKNRQIAFLEFEIQEIENAKLQPQEDEQLEHKYRKLNNAKKIAESLHMVRNCIGYDSMQGAGELAGQALREMAKVASYDEQLENIESMLQDADSLLNDCNRELSAYLDDMTFQDEEFYEIEKRLDLINNLKAKYGQNISDIYGYQKEQQIKLENLLKYEENYNALKEKIRKAQEILEEKSYALSELRKQYSKKLEIEIISQLKDLNFLDVNFSIDFIKCSNYSENGYDAVEYQISTNPGEPKRPLSKVVSGGELSRIMLAIKTLLADRDEIETLIFDEIDTGISGRTAQKVSEKMALIGQHHQILCITHLPQIAAMADTHFEIRKEVRKSETITQISPLKEEETIRELARLLGGAQITDLVVQNAKEMKELAQVHKNSRVK